MSKKSALGVIAAVTVLYAAALVALSGAVSPARAESMIKTPPASSAKTAPPAAAAPALPSPLAAIGAPVVPTATPELTDAEFNAAFKLRKMGKPDAPLKLTEFASLSCPHCAAFNSDTLPQIKKDYIDTGKVEYTFVDFPLNGPALVAAAAALCVPDESYFRYTDYLFKTQSDWVFNNQIKTILIQDAKLLGANGDKVERCINSQRLKSAIADRFKKESEAFGIDSTPSFVFNGEKSSKFSGEMSYPNFKKVIEIELARKAKKDAAAK